MNEHDRATHDHQVCHSGLIPIARIAAESSRAMYSSDDDPMGARWNWACKCWRRDTIVGFPILSQPAIFGKGQNVVYDREKQRAKERR